MIRFFLKTGHAYSNFDPLREDIDKINLHIKIVLKLNSNFEIKG